MSRSFSGLCSSLLSHIWNLTRLHVISFSLSHVLLSPLSRLYLSTLGFPPFKYARRVSLGLSHVYPVIPPSRCVCGRRLVIFDLTIPLVIPGDFDLCNPLNLMRVLLVQSFSPLTSVLLPPLSNAVIVIPRPPSPGMAYRLFKGATHVPHSLGSFWSVDSTTFTVTSLCTVTLTSPQVTNPPPI